MIILDIYKNYVSDYIYNYISASTWSFEYIHKTHHIYKSLNLLDNFL